MFVYLIDPKMLDDLSLGELIGGFLGMVVGVGAAAYTVDKLTAIQSLPVYVFLPLLLLSVAIPFGSCILIGLAVGGLPTAWRTRK